MQLADTGGLPRAAQPYITFLFFRLLMPSIMLLVLAARLRLCLLIEMGSALPRSKLGDVPRGHLPSACTCRKCCSVERHEDLASPRFRSNGPYPDALDLLLICVESGMSIEAGVSQGKPGRLAAQSDCRSRKNSLSRRRNCPICRIADSRLREPRQAHQSRVDASNRCAWRCIQAERYGTPIGADAARDGAGKPRHTHERKPKRRRPALPPKLTVPMILFFLPVLFAVILTPALIQIFHWD